MSITFSRTSRGTQTTESRSSGSLLPALSLFLAGLLLFSCSDGGKKQGPPKDPPKPKTDIVAETFAQLSGRHDLSKADGNWKAWAEVQALSKQWEKDRKPGSDIAELWKQGRALEGKVLELDPHHGAAREARGERRYQGELLPFVDAAEWLTDVKRQEARKVHESMERLTSKTAGWAPKNRFEPLDKLLLELKPIESRHESFADSEFYKKSKVLESATLTDINDRFKDLEKEKFLGIEMVALPEIQPYVFFVQKNPSWDPKMVALSRSRSLLALHDIIMSEYGKELGLKPMAGPVPVLMFRSHAMFSKYAGGASSAYAHFEHDTGRLCVHDDCDHTTIMHEGTHQLFAGWTTGTHDLGVRTYWFNEGIAEWYSGAARHLQPDGTYTYDVGLLNPGRCDSLRKGQGDASQRKLLFKVKELVETRYQDRPRIRRTFREGNIYSQGWFLIYFLNHFNVDDKGELVDPRKPGVYRDRWVSYVKEEFRGDGGLDVFKKCLQLDDAALDKMETEYWRYFEWVQRKRSLGHVKDLAIIPWDEYEIETGRRKGEKTGERLDDLLPAFDPESAPVSQGGK